MPAVAGAALWIRGQRNTPSQGERPSKWMWISAVAVTGGVAIPLALSGAWHDELGPTGHMSIAAQMQNGGYPPRFLPFVEHELHYHYGFNIAAAGFSAFFRFRLDNAIDVVTCTAWFYTWCLLWVLGERMLGRGRGAITATLGLFGGGAAPLLVLLWPGQPLSMILSSRVIYDRHHINAPLISYFFQHPWSAGLPLALALLLVFMDRSTHRQAAWHGAIALLLVAIATCQFVLFVTFLGCAVGAEAFCRGPHRIRRVAAIMATAFAALLCATQMRGFFAPNYGQEGHGIVFGSDLTAAWQFISIGLISLFGVLGFFFAPPRLRVFLFFLATGSLLVQNIFRYQYTNDIAKFGNTEALALALLSAAFVAKILSLGSHPLRIALTAAVLGLSTVGGIGFAAMVISHYDVKNFASVYAQAGMLPGDDQRALAFLRRQVGQQELVYRAGPPAAGYAQWGGLAGPWTTTQVRQFGFTRRDIERFSAVFKELPHEVDRYLSLRVHWMVLAPGDRRLNELSAQWVSSGRAELVATFGSLRIIKLLPRNPARVGG